MRASSWYLEDAIKIMIMILKLVAIILISRFLLKRSSKLFSKLQSETLEKIINTLGVISLVAFILIIAIYGFRIFEVTKDSYICLMYLLCENEFMF